VVDGQTVKYSLLSALIGGVLLAQGVSGFRGTQYLTPFLSYPMYSKAHFEGERLDVNHRVYAVLKSGERRYIDPDEDLNVDFWRYERRFVTPLIKGRSDEVAPFVDAVVARYPDVTALEVDNYPMIITRAGPKPAPSQTIVRREVAAADRSPR
jgi:hypothetical protein